MNNIKTIAIAVVSILNIFSALAQTNEKAKLDFEIKDAVNKAPIGSVSCRVYSPEDKLRTYAISNYNGQLSVSAYADEHLTFSIMGYKSVTKRVSECQIGSLNEIFLSEEAVEIKEISVKAPPIRAHNDTIEYSVRSFTAKGDEHLEDVLRKMPGIDVSENGSVMYQGKAINKLYIDGKDLLGENYQIATRNMPLEAVTAVEVFEAHQPVKLLRGRQPSDEAALNLKIDKSHKSVPFGEAKVGLGLPWAKWDNQLFLTELLENDQFLVSGKMNNVGTILSNETQPSVKYTEIDAFEPDIQPVTTVTKISESMPQNRYVNNKSYNISSNIHHNLSDDAMIRLNVALYSDSLHYETYHNNTYGGNNIVTEEESRALRQKNKAILPSLKYELNSANIYLSDELKYLLSPTEGSSTITNNGARLIEQTKQKPWYVQNYLSTAIPLRKNVLQVKSYIRYSTLTEDFQSYADSVEVYNAAEKFKTQSFINKNIISTSIELGRNTLNIRAKAYYKHNTYDNAGRTTSNNLQLEFSPSYSIAYNYNKDYVTIEIPIKWEAVKLNGGERKNMRKMVKISPNLFYKQHIGDNWQFVLSGAINSNVADGGFRSAHDIRTSYNTIDNPTNDIFFSSSRSVASRLSYRNMATMVFSNMIFSYTHYKNENFTDIDYSDSFIITSVEQENNDKKMLIASGALDKTFTDIGLTLKSGVTYNSIKFLLAQSGIKTSNKSNSCAANLGFDFNKFDWLRFQNNVQGTIFWEANSYHNSNKLKRINYAATAFFFLPRSIEAKLKFESLTTELSPSRYKSSNFFDGEASYTISKNWKASLAVTNILDVTEYSTSQNSGISNYQNSLPLRGREFMLSVKWKF
ncbi:MAG: hypothetical protein E7069_05275 [Bacteroidales bacterium]|nr:hypothetical protein [Bacteroidales bacterium]